jgi:hypothetical protein
VPFSPEIRLMASCGLEENILRWDAASLGALQTLVVSADFLHCPAFRPDGRRLAAGSGAPNASFDQGGRGGPIMGGSPSDRSQ